MTYLNSLETCHSKSQEDHQNPSLIVNRVLTSRQLQCFFSKLEFSNNAKVAIQKIGKNHYIKYTRKLEFYDFTRWMGRAYFRLDKVNWHYAKWTKAMLCHYIVLWDREMFFFCLGNQSSHQLLSWSYRRGKVSCSGSSWKGFWDMARLLNSHQTANNVRTTTKNQR